MVKPIYVGAQIIDSSTIWMNCYHYKNRKAKFVDVKTLYGDTGSILYPIKTKIYIKDIPKGVGRWLNTSVYAISEGDIELGVKRKENENFKIKNKGYRKISFLCQLC